MVNCICICCEDRGCHCLEYPSDERCDCEFCKIFLLSNDRGAMHDVEKWVRETPISGILNAIESARLADDSPDTPSVS